MMTIADFRSARARIQPHIRRTPVVPCDLPNLFMKLESLQHTRSFKVRGAFARILELREEGDPRHVLTVSAGNHGQAIARAAAAFGLPCTVVVDDVVLVSEAEIQAALQHLLKHEKLLVEGAAACAFAAVAAGKIAASGPIVAVMTGGNIDLERLC
jgi:threonine dehydratase